MLTTAISPYDVQEALKQSKLQYKVEINNTVLPSDTYDETQYYHLDCNMLVTLDIAGQTTPVGLCNFHIIDTSIYSDISSLQLAISENTNINMDVYDLWEAFRHIYNEDIDDNMLRNAILGGKVAVLNSLEIYPQFQRQGIGSTTLKKLKDYLDFLEVNSIMLIPSPIGERLGQLSWAKKQENLISFYRRNAFKVLIAHEDNYVAIYKF